MRLCLLTNFYPPASKGGYEQWCQEIAEGLSAKGHEIVVLTSSYLKSQYGDGDPDWVRRELSLEMEFDAYANALRFFSRRKRIEAENNYTVENLLTSFRPDGVCVWGMWNLNRSLLEPMEKRLPGRVVYYIGDYWPFLPSQLEVYWQAPAKNLVSSIPKSLLGYFARKALRADGQYQPKFDHVLYPSRYMQDEFLSRGIKPAHAQVIYGAASTASFAGLEKPSRSGRPLSLLYVGRLEHEKGVHTAVQAAALLVKQHRFTDFRLTIVGAGESAYEKQLHEIVRENDLYEFVSFSGPRPKEMMPELYSQADVFLFTSIWQEPFGRVLVEAMASGTVVVGTATGGAAEVLLDGQTGLVFPPSNAEILAEQIYRLANNSDLYQMLAQRGRKFAIEKFSSSRMVDEIEDYFLDLLAEPVIR